MSSPNNLAKGRTESSNAVLWPRGVEQTVSIQHYKMQQHCSDIILYKWITAKLGSTTMMILHNEAVLMLLHNKAVL